MVTSDQIRSAVKVAVATAVGREGGDPPHLIGAAVRQLIVGVINDTRSILRDLAVAHGTAMGRAMRGDS